MCAHGALHLRLDSEQFLHMMPDLMRQNIGLRESSGRAEASLQFIVKTQVDINLLVVRTVERPGRGLCHAAGGIDRIAEEHELGMAVRRSSLLLKDLGPRALRVVENE